MTDYSKNRIHWKIVIIFDHPKNFGPQNCVAVPRMSVQDKCAAENPASSTGEFRDRPHTGPRFPCCGKQPLCVQPTTSWTARPSHGRGVARFRDLGRVTPSLGHAPSDTFSSKLCRGSRLTHRREGRRDQQLVCLPDRAHPSLRRPRPAGPTGFLTDAGALTQILVHPGVDELVEPAELARPACRQG